VSTPPLFHRAPTRAEFEAAAQEVIETLESEIATLKNRLPDDQLALELNQIRDRYWATLRRVAARINTDPRALQQHVRNTAIARLDSEPKA
jgi:hypothetical protein